MKNNQVIVGFGDGMGGALAEAGKNYDATYAYSRTKKKGADKVIQIQCDIANGIDVSMIPLKSVQLFVYIISKWDSQSDLTDAEFKEYFEVGPSGFLASFNSLKDAGCLADDALIVGIGSTASEGATRFAYNSSAGMYSVSKLTQKALVIQLMRKYKQYRYMNLTLGSINDWDGVPGVGYKNVINTIKHFENAERGLRYSESILVSNLDVEYP